MKINEKIKELSNQEQLLLGIFVALAELCNCIIILTTIFAVALLYHFGAGWFSMCGLIVLLMDTNWTVFGDDEYKN